MTGERLSEETVNAFVDGELDRDERLHVIRLSEAHDGIRRQLCEARTLKDLVGQAYEEGPEMERSAQARSGAATWTTRRALAAAAAVVIFAAGIVTGRFLPAAAEPALAGGHEPVFLELSELESLAAAGPAHGAGSNIVLHLATGDAGHVEDALDKIERFVAAQHAGPRQVGLEIVANGEGLDLLRVARTPYEARFKRLARDDYVTILACQQAVQRLRERGVTVDLIPEADLAGSALDRIIQRLREGWVYVRV